MIKIGPRHDKGTFRLRHLGAVDREKAMCPNGRGCPEV